jgi:hypothetical protein
MKRLTRNLRDSSIEAFILALETINRPTILYRMEAFCILFCNAWELIMKAKILDGGSKIFYRKKRKQPRLSLSLDDCLKKVFTSEDDPVRLNIEKIHELRNNATHLVISFIPIDIMGLFQAGVINFPRALQDWFSISLSERIPLGMMVLVYDFDPEQYSLENARIRRRISVGTFRWLTDFQTRIQRDAASLGNTQDRFCIPINYKLAIVRNPRKSDIVLSAGGTGQKGVIIERPRSPDVTHPYRRKEVIELVNDRLQGSHIIKGYDINCVREVFKIESKSEFYYKDKFSPRRYSNEFVDWIVRRARRNRDFFNQTRRRAKRLG